MISTAVDYNPYTTVRDVDMVITYPVVSETAAGNATYSTNGQTAFSDLSQLNNLNYTDTKYATCEDGLVMLDGSFRFLPDVLTNQQIGWWSDVLSDSNGEIDRKLTVSLSEEETVVGFTIHFAKTNPIKSCTVKVSYYSTELYYETFTASDSGDFIIDLPISGFNEVSISDIKTAQPRRRVKMLGFQFGITKRWNRNNIVSASVEELADYTGNTLPINTLKVEFDNSTKEFDVFRSTRQYVYRDAMRHANISAQNANQVAQVSQLINTGVQTYKYATCENDYVMLNNDYKYVPTTITNSYQIGYLNNAISDTNGEFSNTPSVSYAWNNEINISGFKLYFVQGNHATNFTITAYNDNSIIKTETFENIDPVLDSRDKTSVIGVDFSISGCDKIKFEFNEVAEKNRFVKVSKICVMRYVDSWGNYLSKRQKIIAEFVVNGEQIPMGDTYLFDSLEQKNGGLTAEITAKSAVSYLDNQKYDGSNVATAVGVSISEVLDGTEITTAFTPSSLYFAWVNKTTPKDTTKRAAIHYFAQAAQATCFFDRQGVLNIKSLEAGDFVDTIDVTNIYSSDIGRMNEYVNMIRLTVKNEYTDPETTNTYYGGSGLYYRELQNNCVSPSNGNSVASWLLKQYERRVYFEIKSRGNPALELGDTIQIVTEDGTVYLGVIYEQLFEYDGGLTCTIKAVEPTKN